MVPRHHIPHGPTAGLSHCKCRILEEFSNFLIHLVVTCQPTSLRATSAQDPQTGTFTLADPTTNAYARAQRIGTPRSHVAATLSIPGAADLAADVTYSNKFDMWSTLRDCYDGEATIKDAGQQYLPKLAAHKDGDYLVYKSRAYFYNAVRRTHRGLMGSLFRKPVEFTLPSQLESRLSLKRISIDAKSAADFCRTLGHEVLLTGRFGILADFKDDNWQSPYLAGYLAENIFSWRTRVWKDREIVDRVVLLEQEPLTTEYGFTTQLLVRVLRLDPNDSGTDLVYSQTEIRPVTNPTATEAGVQPTVKNIPIAVRAGRTLNYIPFVFVNATNTRPDVGPAPLEDIATINISHYQSTAHLEHGRFYAGMPTYVTSGDASGSALPGLPEGLANPSPLTVGPSYVWELEKDAKAWLLEFNGHGLTFLENAVDSKQLQMQSLGGRLISSTRRAAALSDEAWQLLETGDEATLMDVACTADEAMSTAIAYMGDIMGAIPDMEKHGVAVEFNKEFVRSELTARELRALQALRERGHIPEDVMYYALREVGVIPIEYTLEDFKALMARKDQQYEPPLPPASGGLDIGPAGGGPTPGVRPRVAPRPASNPANNPRSGSPD